MKNLLHELGPLRLSMAVLALLTLIIRPDIGGEIILEDWRIFPTLIMPVLSPMLIMGFLLDALMSTIFKADAKQNQDEAKIRHFKLIARFDLVLVALLIAAWSPFFLSLRG